MEREPVNVGSTALHKGPSETEKPETAEDQDEGGEGGEGEGEGEEGEGEGEEGEEKARKSRQGTAQTPIPPGAVRTPAPMPPQGKQAKVARPGAVAEPSATNKSDLTEADLLKSLEALQRISDTQTPASRKDALLEKARSSELSKSERDELFGLMGGETQPTQTFANAVTTGMQTNDTIQKAIDVSDYLSSHQEELVKALTMVGGAVEQQDRRQHEFNLVLAKAVCDIGNLVKAVSERMGVIETQPAHAPKSATGAKVLSKSFAGMPPAGDQLSKGEILQTMTEMMQKSIMGGGQGLAPCGEDIVSAVAKYEQTGLISKGMQSNVIEFRKSRTA